MKKNKVFVAILCIHVLCGILGVVILCSVPEADHVRWNAGYIIGWLFLLSALFMAFLVPKQLPQRIGIPLRIYTILFWFGWIPLLFIPKGLFFLFAVFSELGGNSPKVAENDQYILRLYVTSSLFDHYNEKQIYRKQGLREVYVGCFDSGDRTPIMGYDIKEFQVDEKNLTLRGKGNIKQGYAEDSVLAKDTLFTFPIDSTARNVWQ